MAKIQIKNMDQNYQNPQSQSMEPLKPDNNRNRIAIIVSIALLVVGAAALVMFYLIREESINTGEIKDSTSSFLPFIPIWIAIFIPSLLKKKNQKPDEKQKRALLAVVIGTLVLVLAGLAAWLYYVNK